MRIIYNDIVFNVTVIKINIFQLESLQQENDQLKDKLEEVTLDLEILKNEVSEGGKIPCCKEYMYLLEDWVCFDLYVIRR